MFVWILTRVNEQKLLIEYKNFVAFSSVFFMSCPLTPTHTLSLETHGAKV